MRVSQANNSKLERDRQSIFYYGEQAQNDRSLMKEWRKHRSLSEGASMLLQDVHLGLLPIGNSSNAKWSVQLSSRTEQSLPTDAEALVTQALNTDGHSYDLRDALQEFLPDCARNVVLEGTSVYEIEVGRDAETNTARCLKLVHIPKPGVRRNLRGWFQRIPLEMANRLNSPRHIHLNDERVVVFRWPNELGSNRYRQATLEAVGTMHSRLIPPFYLPEAEIVPFLGMCFPRRSIPFDYKYHSKTRFIAYGKIGRCWGYNHRTLLADEMGDFLFIERTLKWNRFLTQLREAMLLQLNTALIQMEKLTKPLGQIKVQGLPTVADCDNALHRLTTGPASYNDLTKPFRL